VSQAQLDILYAVNRVQAKALIAARRKRDEARAELAFAALVVEEARRNEVRAESDRDALRAAIEKHNADLKKYGDQQEHVWLIPLPPAAEAPGDGHASDCATHNAPALPVGPCDCGAAPEAGPKPAGRCEICGEQMPRGEEMFKFHGYSGSCPRDVEQQSIAPEVKS
jgi:hypothetical protein